VFREPISLTKDPKPPSLADGKGLDNQKKYMSPNNSNAAGGNQIAVVDSAIAKKKSGQSETKSLVLIRTKDKAVQEEKEMSGLPEYLQVIRTYWVSTQDAYALEQTLKEAIHHAREEGADILWIEAFHPFQNNPRNVLQLLADSPINFQFADFAALGKDSIGLLIEFLELRQKKTSEAAVGAEDDRSKNVKAGNPNIASREIVEKATLARQRLPYFDNNHKYARIKISELKQKGLSNNRIAQELNQEGIRTRRGKLFQAKQVERLLEMDQDLRRRFVEEYPELERRHPFALKNSRSETENLEIDLPDGAQVTGPELKFNFTRRPRSKIRLSIFDNQGEERFAQDIAPDANGVALHLIDETPLFPGRHYLVLKGKEEDPEITKVVLIRPDLLAQDENRQFDRP
jgi:hypothetical protein